MSLEEHRDDAPPTVLIVGPSAHHRSPAAGLFALEIITRLQIIYRAVRRLERRVGTGARAGIGLRAFTHPKDGTGNMGDPIKVQARKGLEDVLFIANPKDAAGGDTKPTLEWHSDNNAVVSIAVNADTLGARGITGEAGLALITVTDGVVVETATVEVVEAPPGTINLQAAVAPKGV